MSLGERVPKLRFPGFEGEWKKRDLKDCLSVCCKRNKQRFTKDEVLSVSGEYGIVNQIEFQGRSFAGESISNYKVVLPGLIVYTKSPLREAPYGIVKASRIATGIVSPLYGVYIANEGIEPCFIESYFANALRRNRYFKPLVNLGPKHTMCISDDGALGGTIVLPEKEEQSKICDLLATLNSRIAAQRKLVELLKKHKRGLIKRLFRPNEHTKWKSVRLGDVGTFHKGAPLSKADISEDGKPFILYGELYTTYGEIIKDVVRRTTAEIDIPYLSRCGDVIIPTSGETAEEIATASCIMSDGVVLGGDLNIYRSEHIDGRFLAYAVRFIISRDISRIAQGVSVVHISATELKRISVSIPSKDEQIRIISVLENYDNRILHSQEILKKMETTKDGLLQQLFV